MTGHPVPQDVVQNALARWCEGLSQAEIALSLGYRKTTVRAWLVAALGQAEYDRLCQARTGKTAEMMAEAAKKSHTPKAETIRKETRAKKEKPGKPKPAPEEEKPKRKVVVRCWRCGSILVKGACGACQEIAERIERRRQEGRLDG